MNPLDPDRDPNPWVHREQWTPPRPLHSVPDPVTPWEASVWYRALLIGWTVLLAGFSVWAIVTSPDLTVTTPLVAFCLAVGVWLWWYMLTRRIIRR